MTFRNSILFTLLLSSCVVVMPVRIANSCGGWDYFNDEAYISPFYQGAFSPKIFEPFLFTDHIFYQTSDIGESDKASVRDVNIHEWAEHFKNKYPEYLLKKVIFDTDTATFNKIKKFVRSEELEHTDSIIQNRFTRDMRDRKFPDEWKYLCFAKSTEPYAQRVSYWSEDMREERKNTMMELLDSARYYADEEKNTFLKQRYIYQALRLAHHSGADETCVDLYKQYEKFLDFNSDLAYWCLSLKAGADNDVVQAAYDNSLVFDRCPSRSMTAAFDFNIQDEADWTSCLALCKNKHEQEILWTLTGFKNRQAALFIMQQILDINPASEGIELLLAREMEYIQRAYMPDRYSGEYIAEDYGDGGYDERVQVDPGYLQEVDDFILSAVEKYELRTPSFWYSADAFLKYIQHDYIASSAAADKAFTLAGDNKNLQTQANIFKALSYVEQLTSISPLQEGVVANYFLALRMQDYSSDYNGGMSATVHDAYVLMMHHLSQLYTNNQDWVKAEICNLESVTGYSIYNISEEKTVYTLYQFRHDKNGNIFDSFLRTRGNYTDDDLLEILGTFEINNDNFDEALKFFGKMQDTVNNYNLQLSADPFMIHLWDCHDCDYAAAHEKYTKMRLCRELIQLKNKVERGEATAEVYHQLGNAYYNMSYYGNSWKAKGHWYGSNTDPDCSRAKEYYSKAIEKSSDREFIAFNLFLMGKCEQNTWFESGDFSWDNADGLKKGYQESFAKLKQEYASTDIYQEALTECRYFDYYVSHY